MNPNKLWYDGPLQGNGSAIGRVVWGILEICHTWGSRFEFLPKLGYLLNKGLILSVIDKEAVGNPTEIRA